MKKASSLLCTVGTSLLGNLGGLAKAQGEGDKGERKQALAKAYQEKSWSEVASLLSQHDPHERVCGAEINSVASMLEKEYISKGCGLFFFYSDTTNGKEIAEVLKAFYEKSGHSPVEAIAIPSLQDQDPKAFRTKGLRNLARKLCEIVRQYGTTSCAINATGGYKAQIAIAVMLGQALGIPVYYKHELFSEIISFPPMPISLDFELWMRMSGMLFNLEDEEPLPFGDYEEGWDERFESLVEREWIDGKEFLVLSATGQIFHDTFRERFRSERDAILPVRAINKKAPRLERAGSPGTHPEVQRFMQKVTDETPFVVSCSTHYYNPDLSKKTRFHLAQGAIECVFSKGSYCVKFIVETTATTEGQKNAAIAYMNDKFLQY